MLLLNIKIIPHYKFMRDRHSTAKRYVLLRNIQYVYTSFESDKVSLTRAPLWIMQNTRMRVPNEDFLPPIVIPDLTLSASQYTLYSRTPVIEGSDTQLVPASQYLWRTAAAYHDFDEELEHWRTIYVVSGRWNRWQGMFHSLERTT